MPRVQVKEKSVRLINPPWPGLSKGLTMLFEGLVLQVASHMQVHTVTRIIKESDYKIWSLLEHYVTRVLANNDYSELKTVGMNETSKRKGHDYITLFVDLDQRRTIFITQSKDKKTVRAFFNDLKEHRGKPEHITDVSCDMSPAFIKGIAEYLPNAKITFDRFHSMKIL